MKRICVTGGSGFLGQALLDRLSGEVKLTALSRSEKSQLPLRRRYPEVRFLLGDVRDRSFLRSAFADHDAVIHAAALKHVDLSEAEPTEYTKVNVAGSINVAEIAAECGIERVVGVSTDKACDPLNTYGVTKLLMERCFAEHGHVCVRYGNVIGSAGSVLEVWRRQLSEGGPIKVTDPHMTRFFFSADDAVDEVLWSLQAAPAGCVVVPMLRSVKLIDLAVAFMHASGVPDVTIGDPGSGALIEVIGPRPGEKQHESLLSEREAAVAEMDGDRAILRPGARPSEVEARPHTSSDADRVSSEDLGSWLAGIVEVAA